MTDIIRKQIVEVIKNAPEVVRPTVYEKVTERVERFTVEQIDSEVANLQNRIDELNAKKASAEALNVVPK